MRFVLFFATATLAIAGEFTTSVGDTYPFKVSAIATDATGNTYVVGSRMLGGYSLGAFITGITTGYSTISQALTVSETDVFVTKLDPTGKALFTDTFAGKVLTRETPSPSIRAAISISRATPHRMTFL